MKLKSTAALGIALLTACSSDGAGPETALSRTEALAIATAIITAGETAASGTMEPQGIELPTGIDAVPVEFTHQQTSSHPCPSGGLVAFAVDVTGTVDEEVGSFEVALDGTQTHDQCAWPHQDLTLTVSGDPHLQFAATAAVTNGVPSAPFTFSVAGAFAFTTSDGRAGECVVSIDAVTDFALQRRTLEAQVCGHTLSQTTTWS